MAVTRSRARFTREGAALPSQARIRSMSAADALMVVEWLNAAKGNAAYRRVLAIRRKLEDLRAMIDSLRQQMQDARARRERLIGRQSPLSPQEVEESVQRAELRKAFRERHNSLNRDLSRYTFCPVMSYDPSYEVWRYNAIPRKPRGPVIEVTLQGITVQVSAATAAAALARLAAQGELHKVRLCEWCKKRWRVSERECD